MQTKAKRKGGQGNWRQVPPHASILIESMRNIGYSLETALADVIDNSITAGAKTVDLWADTTSESPSIAIRDDGCGMLMDELVEAMRPGTKSPLQERDKADLGRFGLGLKTASFSQCRRLTVLTRKDGSTACARWDLDDVAIKNDWVIELVDDHASVPRADCLGKTGTIVVWEKLDRLVSDTGGQTQSSLVSQIDDAVDHLQLAFHRFMSGERGLRKVNFAINQRPLVPFDPFHSTHDATQAGACEVIPLGGHKVTIQPFTLPHHKKVSKEEWERNGGKEGYLKNQGFYVYRGHRLIIHGTWFGLAKQAELTKLTRVRIDMPNGLDAEWKIDVKKASARPPEPVRDRLKRIIEEIGATSKRVYTSRGQQLVSDNRLPVWNRIQNKNEVSYALNSEHPFISGFTAELPDNMKKRFTEILEMAGSTIPIDTLFADISGNPESMSSGRISEETLTDVASETFDALKAGGLPRKDIAAMMRSVEPFKSNWPAVSNLLKLD